MNVDFFYRVVHGAGAGSGTTCSRRVMSTWVKIPEGKVLEIAPMDFELISLKVA